MYMLILIIMMSILLLFFSIKTHILKTLLTLEFFMLNSVFMAIFNTNNLITPPTLIFLFFTMAVCEASIGVSVLIGLMRNLGNELFETLW